MAFGKYLARQLSNPTGLVAGSFLPRLWNRRNAALNDLTLACLDLSPDNRVLDVGCGGGYLLEQMSRAVYDGALSGVDISDRILAHCRWRLHRLIQIGQLELSCASAESLPFNSETFTRACTVNAIFYFPDPAGALSELWRILAPGGRAVITLTQAEDLVDRPFARHGLNLYSEQEVRSLMEQAGFAAIQQRSGCDRHRRFFSLTGQKE